MWYEQYEFSAWEDICAHFRKCYSQEGQGDCRWVFRGELFCKTPCTKLEDVFDLYGVTDEKMKRKAERQIIRKFQRRASLYVQPEPDKDDILEWLAVMQHHEAPTRLLDSTYSFYIALYFALARQPSGTVWAVQVNTKPRQVQAAIYSQHQESGSRKYKEFRDRIGSMNDVLRIREEGEKLDDVAVICYLMDNPLTLVYPVNPFRLNRRLSVQQGLFLASGNIAQSFEENLKASLGGDDAAVSRRVHQVKLVGTKDDRKHIIRELQDMNISNEALFPGLDGFARSTAELLARPLD